METFIKSANAPHYTEIAKHLGVTPDEGKEALHDLTMLAGDLGFIEREKLEPIKEDIAEIESMLKALVKSLENKPLTP